MTDRIQRVRVNILDKEYQVGCEADEKPALLEAAREVDARMRKIRYANGMVGTDRIAVMVALNLCHELKQAKQAQLAQQKNEPPAEHTLESLSQKLGEALDG